MFERNFADLGHVFVHWFDRAVFVISRLVLFLIRRGNPLKMYFEVAEKQASAMLKMRCATDVFLGIWLKFTKQLF